jgi:hypothetical protein
MDSIRSALTVSQPFKDNEPVNLTNTLHFYNETDCVMNFNEYEVRLLHHNVYLLLLYNIKRSTNLPVESLNYIQNYQLIYRKVIKEAKRREADRLILSAKNKNKALWKITNKEIGNSRHVSNFIINTRAKIITNPQIITERFNICFTEVIEDLLSQANYHCPQQYLQFQIKNLQKLRWNK